MSDKESGNVLGQYDIPIDILGLDYTMSKEYAEIGTGDQKKRELNVAIDEFLCKLEEESPMSLDLAKLMGSVNFIHSAKQFKPELPLLSALFPYSNTENNAAKAIWGSRKLRT